MDLRNFEESTPIHIKDLSELKSKILAKHLLKGRIEGMSIELELDRLQRTEKLFKETITQPLPPGKPPFVFSALALSVGLAVNHHHQQALQFVHICS